MITVTFLDSDLKYGHGQLSVQIAPYDAQPFGNSLAQFQVPQKEIKMVLRDGSMIIGSLRISQSILAAQRKLNLVRWLTLFDPSDDQYDGNLGDDDEEQPRMLVRFETGSSMRRDPSLKLQQILIDYRDMQQRYQALKDDLLRYRELSEQELKLAQSEIDQLQQENKQIRQQIYQQKQIYELSHQENIQEIHHKLSTLEDELVQEQSVPSNLVEKIKLCFQNITSAYDSLSLIKGKLS